MTNPSIYAAFERMWQHIVAALGGKADKTDIVQPNWSQNNEAATDYVKNRTHWVDDEGTVHKLDEMYLNIVSDEEFFTWLVDADIVMPVTSASGEIYVSNSNELYIL